MKWENLFIMFLKLLRSNVLDITAALLENKTVYTRTIKKAYMSKLIKDDEYLVRIFSKFIFFSETRLFSRRLIFFHRH